MAKVAAKTKKEKAMVIYLKDGVAAKVEEGTEITFGDYEYAIVSEVKNEELSSLKLHKKDSGLKFVVNAAYVSAFNYEHECGRANFVKDLKKLRKSFLKNVEKIVLRQDEDFDIKKFMYTTYLKANN